MQGSSPPIGLYVHVPFCVSKCAYCDFASYAGREADIPRYVDAVVREIMRRGEETGHPKADTIFLGGGTPSLLDSLQVTRISRRCSRRFPLSRTPRLLVNAIPERLGVPRGRFKTSLSFRERAGVREALWRIDGGSPHPNRLPKGEGTRKAAIGNRS